MMAIRDMFSFARKVAENTKRFLIFAKPPEGSITGEQFKGEVQLKEIRGKIGDEHPFDIAEMELIYRKFGFVTGVVDKYVDFIVGGGFYVKSESPQAEQIIQDFMRDVNFDTILRQWVKDALIKGTGYLEIAGTKNDTPLGLKVLDAKWMYIKRDTLGVIENVNQLKLNKRRFSGSLLMDDFNKFNPDEMGILAFNKIGDDIYGMGIIYPASITVDRYLQAQKDMHTILQRKANTQIHVKLGSPENQPTADDITAFGQKLEWMNNKREWVTGPDVEIKTVDYGNIGEKFATVLKHDEDFLFFTFQVPEVLMGRGSIPEGLAAVQMEAFQRRVQSFQAEIEKVIENQIFRRVLRANNLDVHVEFEWGEPSQKEINERIQILLNVAGRMNTSPALLKAVEKDLALQLGYDETVIESIEEEREREEEQPQPSVPGQNPSRGRESYEPTQDENVDYSLKEWLGFNYTEFIQAILKFISRNGFDSLKAATADEIAAGKFTTPQISALKEVLGEGFKKGRSIRNIAKDISERVAPKNLYKTEDGKIILDEDGNMIMELDAKRRPVMIARTESTRVAANGALEHYEAGEVKETRFMATLSPRTCEICESLNGQIYPVDEAFDIIPVHTNCRCTWSPVVEL